MSTERDELADLIAIETVCTDLGNELERCAKDGMTPVFEQDVRVADAILAVGYSKPRTITTAEELDALRVQSVIRDAEDYVWERFGGNPTFWDCAGVPDWESHLITLPATVLWEPK